MGDTTDERERRLAEREYALATARAALRAEREQVTADRAEVDRLASEARAARNRARRLAGRFARRLEHRNAGTRRRLDQEAAASAADRERFAAEVARFHSLRSEFHTAAAEARDRLRDAWATVESRQTRAADEWEVANRYFTEQTAALDAREAELARRERAAADSLAHAEAETAGLREEAAALEHRARNAREALAELEHRRDRARAELLGTELPAGLLSGSADDSLREPLEREKAAVAALRASLERESGDLNDRRRLVAEQLDQLAHARVVWQRAERQTVAEMEQLARSLRNKEQELDAREQRLIRADARRRQDAYDLWQLRLRLEAWQTKLTAFELRWHTEREQLEADLGHRAGAVIRREAVLGATLARWEQARASDHARLRAELEQWSADRSRMERATEDFERQRRDLVTEVAAYAARALAAEQMVSEAVQDSGTDRTTRRLAVLRKWWGRVFDRRAKEIDALRAEAAAERAAIDRRHRELHRRLAESMEVRARADDRRAAADLAALEEHREHPTQRREVAPAPPAELAELRAEVERLAAAVLEMELPEPTDPPESELPWAIEESDPPPPEGTLAFEPGARAA